MDKLKKIRNILIIAIALGLILYGVYICVHYLFYKEHEKYLTDYAFEQGREFTPLEDADPKVAGMVLVAENDLLKLYTNTKTTEVAIYDKRTGEITYSNPVDRDKDPLANGRNKTDLHSQFLITYYDTSMTQATMYSYDYSVEREQFTMESIQDGIRYTYLLGNLDSPTGIVPPYITLERMEEKILSKLSEREAKTIRNSYIESKEKEGFMELTNGAKASRVGLQKMNQLLEKAGYTQADFDEDAAMAAGGKVEERITFTIVLEYRLQDEKLIVKVPTNQIKETGSGRIANIDLLSFFGAGTSEEEGYIFVPNGVGSLIYFNNGKKTERYNQYVYGLDEVSQSYTVVEDTEKVRLPVFGIKHENGAVFAEITNGETLANIVANVSGNVNSYNYVYPSFLLRGSEKVSMFGASGAGADLPTLEKDIYDVNITIEYAFLDKDNASYSGMANYYRQELMNRGVLTVKEERSSLPFYLDIIGGVKRQESFLGVPYMGLFPMTSFEEAGIIIDQLQEADISNLRVNYLGWFNEGYYHDAAKDIKVDRELGGKKQLKKLNEKLEALGGTLYGDVAFNRISFEADNYNYKMENSRYYSGYIVSLGRVNPATLRQSGGMGYRETNYNVLSPRYLIRHIDKFIDKINQVEISGISLRDLGDVLPSDKRRSEIINRQEAKQIIVGQFEILDDTIDHLMVTGGNAYSFAYARDLINIPSSHNPFYIVDQEVPFYHMVIHGCIDYTSESINLTDSYDKQEIILRMIEFGVAPHFSFSYEESSEIKYTGLNSFYSTQYNTWMEDAVDIYHKTNKVLRNVTNSRMIEHKILDNGIRRITYENGVVIYINKSNEDLVIDDISIPAKGYGVKGGIE